MIQLFEYRLIVEPASAKLAAGRLTSEHHAILAELLVRGLPEADTDEYIDAITSINFDFHLTIARASGNGRLVRAVNEVLMEGERVYRLVIAGMQPSQDHENIAQAIYAGDGERAAELNRSHIIEVRDRIVNSYLSSQAVLEAEISPAFRKSEAGRQGQYLPAFRAD